MIASAHLAYGAASGTFVRKGLPIGLKKYTICLIAFLVGILSHMILDAWPHWEYTQTGLWLWAILFVEVFVVFFFVLGRSNHRVVNYIVFCGMVGGALPDFAAMVYGKLFFWKQLLYFHSAVHVFHGRFPVFDVGWFFQIILAVLAVLYVKLKSA